jgi:hypothetical protein
MYFTPRPKTYKALKGLISSCAKAHSSIGKKNLFGQDKHVKAIQNLHAKFSVLCSAIDIDADLIPVQPDDSWSKFKESKDYYWYTDQMLILFKEIYPSWQDAYSYWKHYYNIAEKEGKKRI